MLDIMKSYIVHMLHKLVLYIIIILGFNMFCFFSLMYALVSMTCTESKMLIMDDDFSHSSIKYGNV